MHDPRLRQALAHALFGGKRLRGLLLLESAVLCGMKREKAVRAAVALECLHSYSLVHDDLPSMDNDNMRRGKPTVHKKFGEAVAILAGDALLTLAFEILADKKTHPDPAVRAELSLILAKAAGTRGMVGGQMLDIRLKKLSRTQLMQMHAMKTGELIRCALEMGAILSGARLGERRLLAEFGRNFGALYQLADDLLDHIKDEKVGRPNAATMLGAEAVRKLMKKHIRSAMHALKPFAERAVTLQEMIRAVARI